MTGGSSRRPIAILLASHWTSLLGVVLVTTAGLCWLIAVPASARHHVDNAYIGILLYLILPVVFFAGLALMPVGIALSRRRIGSGWKAVPDHAQALRKIGLFFGATTLANVVIGSQLVYKAVDHMETPLFCGGSCHVMRPEAVAHAQGAHRKVACVECHVAPGAAGWVQSKINGTRQLYEVTTNSFPRPIPAGLASERLVSSEGTCEHCHSREAGGKARIVAIPKFADDEANTETWTVLTMKLGSGTAAGIHGAHLGSGTTIRFASTDSTRATIPWVEVTRSGTAAKGYFAPGATAASVASLPVHTMSCLDCHNRPAHTFAPAERALDRAMAMGAVPASLPFVKKEGLTLLQGTYADDAAAKSEIASKLAAFYKEGHPDVASSRQADIDRAAAALAELWASNVFPDLKVTWGTYPSHLGHEDSPGCFRCHDGDHAPTGGGDAIANDCATCHEVIATDEAKPAVLETLTVPPAAWIR